MKDLALEIVRVSNANDDAVFNQMMTMVLTQDPPAGALDHSTFNPNVLMTQQAVYMLLMQEEKVRKLQGEPDTDEIVALEEPRTESMRGALQTKLGEHYDAWVAFVKKQDPSLV